MRGEKIRNEYALALPSFTSTPKSVYAAIAYSFASRIVESDDPALIEAAILNEWAVLNQNGIVPQKPKL